MEGHPNSLCGEHDNIVGVQCFLAHYVLEYSLKLDDTADSTY
jgi:hypothetical protein